MRPCRKCSLTRVAGGAKVALLVDVCSAAILVDLLFGLLAYLPSGLVSTVPVARTSHPAALLRQQHQGRCFLKSRPYAQLLYLLVICALVFGQPAAAGSFRSTRAFSARSSSPAAGVFDSPLPQPPPTPPAEPPAESQDCAAEASDDAVLRVSFAAAEARPGQEARLAWTVFNCRPLAVEGIELGFGIPQSFTLSPQDVPAPLSYNPNTRTVSGGLPSLAAGATLTAQFPLRVTGLRAGDTVAVVGEVKDAAGAIIDQHSAELRIVPPATSATEIGAQGGVVELENGRARLAFPPEAVIARSQVLAQPVGHPADAPAYIGRGYEFVVQDPDGRERHTFAASPILTLQYEAGELLPDALHLQDADGQWQRLPTQRDAKARTLRAALPHLSIGASGLIGVTANISASPYRTIVDAVNRGDLAAATEQHRLLEPLARATMTHVPGTVSTKYLLHGLGRISSPRVRLPLVGPEEWEAALIEDDVALVRDLEGVDFTDFRPDRNAAAGGALPKIAGTTR